MFSLKYLMRQGQAVRGHNEAEGNLHQLLLLRQEAIPELKWWMQEGKYMSPEIVNELISEMGHKILRELLSKIQEARWFSLIADETRDISDIEQLTISIRWVLSDYMVHGDSKGLVQVPRTDAETPASTLKDVLIQFMLPLQKCCGQAYDGASNMSGYRSGVAKRIKDSEPAALHVHCLAHCVNLCLQDATRKSPPIRSALDLVYEIVGLIKLSPSREYLFLQMQSQLTENSTSLKPLCPTR